MATNIRYFDSTGTEIFPPFAGPQFTLRDLAALMMAQTINTHDYCQGDTMTWDDVFKEAYRGADAMLRQREEEAS